MVDPQAESTETEFRPNVLTDKQSTQLAEWFVYHAPSADDCMRYERITIAAKQLARVIMETCPQCADQSAALRLVREARMTANASIACKGV